MTQRATDTVIWRSVEELICHGFDRSQVVIVNEAHDGLLRCVRTRTVGLQVLDAAHEIGVRRFAMEALNKEFAEHANELRRLPEATRGFLAQPDMRALIDHALQLGWTLFAYEADIAALSADGPDGQDMRAINRREAEQARNLAKLSSTAEKMLVWCGNGHLIKAPVQEWRPMGFVLHEEHHIDAFAVDQTRTVEWPDRGPSVCVDGFSAQLSNHGGVAGFLRDEAPDGWISAGADAYVLALDNEMT
jgi:hypothetical protein